MPILGKHDHVGIGAHHGVAEEVNGDAAALYGLCIISGEQWGQGDHVRLFGPEHPE